MAAKEHLWRRGSVFYFRMRFPRELLRAKAVVMVNGKPQRNEVKFSLHTSDRKEALGMVATHAAIWTAELERIRLALGQKRGLEQAKALVGADGEGGHSGAAGVVSDERIRAIIVRAFIQAQRHSAEILEAAQGESREARFERLADLSMSLEAYQGEGSTIQEGRNLPADLGRTLRLELKAHGLENLPEEGKTFQAFKKEYRAALVEDLRRLKHELETREPKDFDSRFSGIHASSAMPQAHEGATLDELLCDFDKAQRAKKVSDTTHRANVPVFRALREHFGKQMPLSKITQKEMVAFFEFVETIPVNSHQRFPKKSFADAAATEKKSATPRLLAPGTLKMHHGRVVTIWRHAQDMGMVQHNPANIRAIASRYVMDKKSDRESFKTGELNTIFHAPLFSGCKGDLVGWGTPGPNVPKRGRYWVPLLSLFQGFRLNEACQLEVADVGEVDGIPVIKVTDESEEGEAKGKRVKTKTSKTSVPIHPTILKLGFLTFVNRRKIAGDGSSLFPELKRDKTGRYSNIFSKWFGRFLDKTFGEKGTSTKGTFHCFRHTFRDATRRGMIHAEVADRLGRWKTEGTGSVGRLYGDGFAMPVLRDELAKVEFPGLDLAHLLPAKPERIRTPVSQAGKAAH